jgi:hypothetical protein
MKDIDNPAEMIVEYRKLIAELETVDPIGLGWHDLQDIAGRMRRRWAECQGEDSLHEMAFGEAE